MGRAVEEIKALEFFPRLHISGHSIPALKLPVTMGIINFAYEVVEGSAYVE